MKSFKSLLKQLHDATPTKFRYPLDVAAASMQDTLQNWRMPAYYVRASLHDGHSEGTILYLGERPQYKSWIYNFFGRNIEPNYIGNFSLPQIIRGNNPALMADIILCPINPLTLPLFVRCGWKIIPLHVLSRIDLTKPLDVLASSRDAKNELRIIRKSDYRFQELRSEEALKEFYYEMLKPTVMQRHSENPFLSDIESYMQLYKTKGFLLAAYLGSEWVGANLLHTSKHGTLVSANVGWRGASDELMKKRVVSALLYELIKRASEYGFHTLDLGSSNPFASDGPLNYKLKWGANIELPEIGYVDRHLLGIKAFIAVHFNFSSTSARLMLQNTPLFEKNEANLRVIGWNSVMPSTLQRQIDNGIPWINLAETHHMELPT